MRARRSAVALAIAAGGLSLTASLSAPAEAVGETCQGVPATIVGPDQGSPGGSTISGTPGDDVIVSNGASIVSGGAGNDLICTTGSPPVGMVLMGGTGDDVIDRREETHPTSESRVILGHGPASGADTFYGAAGVDYVYALDAAGPDVVDTGSGDDTVAVVGAAVVRSGTLAVDLGEGDDTLELGVLTDSSIFITEAAFPGNDLSPDHAHGNDGRLQLAGGEGSDELVIHEASGLRMLDLDLAASTLRTGRTFKGSVTGFEDVDATSRGTVRVTGDGRSNSIDWKACRGRVDAGGGADVVRRKGQTCPQGSARKFRTSGGAGDDRLRGAGGRDLLVGGRGRDRGDGGAGADECRSIEVARSC